MTPQGTKCMPGLIMRKNKVDWTDSWSEQCIKPGEELEWTDYRVEERVHGEISRYLRAGEELWIT